MKDGNGFVKLVANTTGGTNFANSNLTFTGNRAHDLSGFWLHLYNGDYLDFIMGDSTFATDAGELYLGKNLMQLYMSDGSGNTSMMQYSSSLPIVLLRTNGIHQAEIDLDTSGLVTISRSLRYTNGNEGSDKILVSDINGISDWKTIKADSIKRKTASDSVFYYIDSTPYFAFIDSTGSGGGGEDLSTTLGIGNTTGGHDIKVSASDSILITDADTGTIAGFSPTSRIKSLALSTYPNLTELSYVKGVTSGLQTQLNGKVGTGRNITINGTTQNLSADRTWNVG